MRLLFLCLVVAFASAGCDSNSSPDPEPPAFVAALANSDWELVSMNGEAARPATLSFGALTGGATGNDGSADGITEAWEGALTGVASCNRVDGRYTAFLGGFAGMLSSIRIDSRTEMGCPTAEDGAFEEVYVDTVNGTVGWQVTGDQLLLSSSTGTIALVYRRV